MPLLFIAAFVASLKWTEEPASTGPALVAAVCFSGQQRQDEDFYKVICVPPPQSLNDVRHFTAWFAPDTLTFVGYRGTDGEMYSPSGANLRLAVGPQPR